MNKLDDLKRRFHLLWGEAHEGTAKYDLGVELLKLIEEAYEIRIPPKASPIPGKKLSKKNQGWNECVEFMLGKEERNRLLALLDNK